VFLHVVHNTITVQITAVSLTNTGLHCKMSSLLQPVRDLQGALNAASDLEREFKEDDKFINEIKTVLNIAMIGFINAFGGALHRLHKTKPSIDAVKQLVESIPDAMSFKNDEDLLPIQYAARFMCAVEYIPILAKIGNKHESGGRGMRDQSKDTFKS